MKERKMIRTVMNTKLFMVYLASHCYLLTEKEIRKKYPKQFLPHLNFMFVKKKRQCDKARQQINVQLKYIFSDTY